MKKYLELIEQLNQSQEELFVIPKTVKVEVANKDEAISLLSTYEPEFVGLNYIKRFHTCYNEESQSCTVELL